MIKAGEFAPEFTLPDETAQVRSLTELLRAGALILYFYPADFTPGCMRQACTMRDISAQLKGAALTVVGVSPQSTQSHARFKAEYALPFVLLSDEQKTVTRLYGVNGPFGIGVRRTTFLISADRRVREVLFLADFRIGRHGIFVRNAMGASAPAQ